MGVSIGETTYGRSASGIKFLKNEYNNCFNRTRKELRGTKYAELVQTIRRYWTGADADAYLRRLEEKIMECERKVLSLQTKLDSALNQDLENFRNFQSQNANFRNY